MVNESVESTTPSAPGLPDPIRLLLEQKLESGVALPFLPHTAAEVVSVCNSEQCDARELAELLQRDQSLASHVLRVANSAAYAPKEPIVSLQQATSRLGLSNISEIAIGVTLHGQVFRVPGFQVLVRELWIHSAAAAFYSREIARALRKNVEAAFLSGLLHDVGKPVVLQALIDALKERTDKPVPRKLAEAAMDHFHGVIGARVLENFGMPEWMGVVVRHHHDYDNAGDHREDAMVTRLADLLAHWAVAGLTPEEFPADALVVAELGLYADDLMALLDKQSEVLDVAEAFI